MFKCINIIKSIKNKEEFMNLQNHIQIRDKKIPIIIRNYKYFKYVKFYFRGNVLNISKPKRLSNKRMEDIIKKNEKYLYEEYLKIISLENESIKHWTNGERIFYKGEEFKIVMHFHNLKRIKIIINENEKVFVISISKEIDDLEESARKLCIDKAVKKILKKETGKIIEKRIAYWSELTKIKYNLFKITDTISKYGSCIPKTTILPFSLRLIMLPLEQIDSVIVHELCHIIHFDHSKDFWNLVGKYYPEYKKIRKYLKE